MGLIYLCQEYSQKEIRNNYRKKGVGKVWGINNSGKTCFTLILKNWMYLQKIQRASPEYFGPEM